MVAMQYLVALTTFFTCTLASTLHLQQDFPTSLLKRQEPGTPAYECHLNCGTAILIARDTSTPCTNSTFLSDYDACLECAGPSNENIWQYYGATLTTYGTECGLSITPVDSTTSTSTTVADSTTSAIAETTTSSISGASTTATGSADATETVSSSGTTASSISGALTTATGSVNTTGTVSSSGTFSPTASSTFVPASGGISSLDGKFQGVFILVLAAVFAGFV